MTDDSCERGEVTDPELPRRPAVWGQAGAVGAPVGSPALSIPFGASCRLRGSFDATPVPCKAVSLCCFIIVLLTNELLGEKFLSGSVFVFATVDSLGEEKKPHSKRPC